MHLQGSLHRGIRAPLVWENRPNVRSGTALFMHPLLSSRRVYKEHLGLSQKVAIGYQAHADTATKSGSLAKTKFVV